MKRWLIGIFIFIFLSLSIIYFVIPSTYSILISLPLKSRYDGVARVLTNNNYWAQWWPGKSLNDSTFEYKDLHFLTKKMFVNTATVFVSKNEDIISGQLSAMFKEQDSTSIQFQSNIPLSSNPFSRLYLYIKARSIKADMADCMVAIQQKFESATAIYGIEIQNKLVSDSSLIALKKSFEGIPHTADIYQMIASLNSYIAANGGRVVNPPMMNCYTEDSIHFEVMIALPVNEDIPAIAPFLLKKMVLGNVLMTEIKGDANAVNKAQIELSHYVQDMQKVAPAIPYQSLITNRMMEKDSTKWITKLYYPVFY